MFDHLRAACGHVITYVKNRLEETSTKVAITTAILSAAALSAPWSYVFIAVSVAFAITPTSGGKSE